MLRFFSALILVAGLGVAAFGGYRYIQEQDEAQTPAAVQEAIVEPDVSLAPPPPPPPPAPVSAPSVRMQSVGRSAEAVEPVINAVPDQEISSGASFQDRLYDVPVAYEHPTSVDYGRSFQVTFAVDGTGDVSAVDALPGDEQRVVEAQAKISDRIKASLVGPGFEIELMSPEVQRLSLLTENVWRWNVTPMEEGEQVLIVELFALDGDEAVPVRTYRDEVVVSVTDFQRVLKVANSLNPIAVVVSGIGTAIGGFFGFFNFFRRRRRRV